jgi:hypothetical protein
MQYLVQPVGLVFLCSRRLWGWHPSIEICRSVILVMNCVLLVAFGGWCIVICICSFLSNSVSDWICMHSKLMKVKLIGRPHTHVHACIHTYIHPVQVIPQSLWLQAHLQLASLGSCHKWGECMKLWARISVCFCSWSSGDVSILADPFIARLGVGCRRVTSEVLDYLCCLRSVAAASGWAGVDTWLLLHGGCYHMTEVGGHMFWETSAGGCHLKSHGVCGITWDTPCDISGFCHGIVEAFILRCYIVLHGTKVKALYILALPTQVNTGSL